ncbi:MAG: nuclear transport factor 2 family protein [Saprospiraceae bacterium]|nr:nuclear transport factor 2 family protein [Saprospiraceae bacterium]
MTTQEIANKWAEYCRTGLWDKAQEELYGDQCISLEMEGFPGGPQRVQGLDAIRAKGQQWNEMVEEFYGVEIEGPIVAGNHFSATMKMDIQMKGQPRRKDEEIAVFRVENGKIVSEQFFYPLG